MLLSIRERFALLAILPREGSFSTLKIVRELREDLSPDEEEHKALQFVQEGETLRWNSEKDVGREFEFGLKATEIIVDALKALDREKVLKIEHLSLYEKFVGDK